MPRITNNNASKPVVKKVPAKKVPAIAPTRAQAAAAFVSAVTAAATAYVALLA